MRGRAFLCFLVLFAPALAGCAEIQDRVEAGLGEFKNSRTAPGDNAVDLLSNRKYSKLVVEIDYVPGSGPEPESERAFRDTLAAYTAKGNNIRMAGGGELPARGSGYKYTWDEIQELERKHRSHYSSGDTAALYVMFVDGGSQEDNDQKGQRVLGAAYHGTSIVMFKENLRAAGKGGGLVNLDCSLKRVEPIVAKHELGHVFGLVNHGIPMQRPHEDPNNPGHSSNDRSVMYWAIENSKAWGVFGSCSDIPTEFDADDKADMAAVRDG